MRIGKSGAVQEYSKSASIHPCKLTKDDLINLVATIRNGSSISRSIKDNFRIRANFQDVYIEADGIEEFLSINELPDVLKCLSITYLGWNAEQEIVKGIYLSFSDVSIGLSVNGKDRTWVLGKYEEIISFLKRKRPWFGSMYRVFFVGSALIAGACIPGFVILIASGAAIAYSISVALLFLAMVSSAYLHFKTLFMPYVQIIVKPKKSFFDYNFAILFLALSSLIVSIVTAIKGH